MVANSRSPAVLGLVGSHAYTIVNNYEVTLNDGSKVKLIKLRNPYGSDGS